MGEEFFSGMVWPDFPITIAASLQDTSSSIDCYCHSVCERSDCSCFAYGSSEVDYKFSKSTQHLILERVSRDVHKAFHWLVADLQKQRTTLPRVIVFCRSISTCASLYKMFLTEMKEESCEYCGNPSSIAYRLFAMYHSQVGKNEKQHIMDSMLNPNGNGHACFVFHHCIWHGYGCAKCTHSNPLWTTCERG